MSPIIPYFLAIEIGGTKLQLALSDQQGQWIYKKRLAVGKSQTASGIQECIVAILDELPVRPTAVGLVSVVPSIGK
ncbi:hypothetical protein HMF3257_38650 [Spirosoma telluris]|uniref:ROK family protein n=1 Tax=Spirosoma telluris TaxID=2183553 RepID=A0A327NGG2_9BACT|nr:hypothetical protein HMF3257_38650 [Spirosoma telluris]